MTVPVRKRTPTGCHDSGWSKRGRGAGEEFCEAGSSSFARFDPMGSWTCSSASCFYLEIAPVVGLDRIRTEQSIHDAIPPLTRSEVEATWDPFAAEARLL
jgi:hypothetical protein